MVGIYAKIKNGLNWLKGKAAKYVAPIVGTIGDFANSEFAQNAASLVSPWLNMAIPGAGTALNTGLSWAGKVGDIANGLAADYKAYGNDFGFMDAIQNVATGKYNRKPFSGVKSGVGLARDPEELHGRIQLKALPSGDEYSRTGSYVEEID